MRDYAFELLYTDGYRVTLKVSQPDRYKAWAYAMGMATHCIDAEEHGELEVITKLYEISG